MWNHYHCSFFLEQSETGIPAWQWQNKLSSSSLNCFNKSLVQSSSRQASCYSGATRSHWIDTPSEVCQFFKTRRLGRIDRKKISRISTSEIWQPYRAPKIHGNCVRDLGVSPDDIRKCKVKRWALEPGIKER